MRKPFQSPGRMKNSSYYIAPVGVRTHDLPHSAPSNVVKVSHAFNHSATRRRYSATRRPINKDNEAQIKSLQQRLFTIYIAVRIASSAYLGISQLSQSPTSQTRSLYSHCQLKIRIAPASNYSKKIDFVPNVNISVRFVRQIIK